MSLPALEVFKYYVYRDRVEETITSFFVPRDFIRSPMAQKVFISFMQSHTSIYTILLWCSRLLWMSYECMYYDYVSVINMCLCAQHELHFERTLQTSTTNKSTQTSLGEQSCKPEPHQHDQVGQYLQVLHTRVQQGLDLIYLRWTYWKRGIFWHGPLWFQWTLITELRQRRVTRVISVTGVTWVTKRNWPNFNTLVTGFTWVTEATWIAWVTGVGNWSNWIW